MQPIDFPQKTKVLSKPAGMTDEECGSLAVYEDPAGCLLSCWKPTWKERLSILFFGKCWLWVWSGYTQPPVCVEGKKTPFIKKPEA